MHQMNLIEKHETGAEVWTCPTCARSLLIQWQPFKKITLDAGDTTAQHSGSKGGMSLDVEIDDRPMSPELRALVDEVMRGLE